MPLILSRSECSRHQTTDLDVQQAHRVPQPHRWLRAGLGCNGEELHEIHDHKLLSLTSETDLVLTTFALVLSFHAHSEIRRSGYFPGNFLLVSDFGNATACAARVLQQNLPVDGTAGLPSTSFFDAWTIYSLRKHRQGGWKMLVLSRKTGEAIQIGDDIEIVVSYISNNRVKLSFRAPREVEILRGELPARQKTIRVPVASDCTATGPLEFAAVVTVQ